MYRGAHNENGFHFRDRGWRDATPTTATSTATRRCRSCRPREVLDTAGDLLRALAAPVRIAIVLQLRESSRCVHELVDALGVPQPLVSQHLRILKSAGVVAGERSGREVLYRLVDHHLAAHRRRRGDSRRRGARASEQRARGSARHQAARGDLGAAGERSTSSAPPRNCTTNYAAAARASA